jgi:signal peptide peptidase SppA
MANELIAIPHLDQYFGYWAMFEDVFLAHLDRARSLDLHLHLASEAVSQAQAQAAQGARYETVGNIAVIEVHGSMMKHVSSMTRGCSTVQARRAVRAARADGDVAGILLHFDTPGGTVAGTAEFAQDVAEAAQVKPVWSYMEDLCASAGYWVASQATRIAINRTGMGGCIGTYGVVYDYSAFAAKEGIKAHVLRAGKYKGAGTPGTEITQEQLAEWQRNIDQLNEHFLAGVASGRRMAIDRVRELADGRVHVGEEAKKLGLVDAVESLDQTFSQFVRQTSNRRSKAMAEHVQPQSQEAAGDGILKQGIELHTGQTGTLAQVGSTLRPQIASYEEIVAACPGASADFLVKQLAAKTTVAQAQANFMAAQQAEITAIRQELQQARTQGSAKKPGVEPVRTEGNSSESTDTSEPVAEYGRLVREAMGRGLTRAAAALRVAADKPDLHQAFLLATNQGAKVQRLIREKYE